MGIKFRGVDLHGGPIRPSKPMARMVLDELPEFFGENPLDVLESAVSDDLHGAAPDIRIIRAMTSIVKHTGLDGSLPKRVRKEFPELHDHAYRAFYQLATKARTGSHHVVVLHLSGRNLDCADEVAGLVLKQFPQVAHAYTDLDNDFLLTAPDKLEDSTFESFDFAPGWEVDCWTEQFGATNVHQLLDGRLATAVKGADYILGTQQGN